MAAPKENSKYGPQDGPRFDGITFHVLILNLQKVDYSADEEEDPKEDPQEDPQEEDPQEEDPHEPQEHPKEEDPQEHPQKAEKQKPENENHHSKEKKESLEFIKELKSFAPLLLCIVVACLCIWFLFVVIGSKKF